MVTLTGKHPKDTYKDLLQVSNENSGIDGTSRAVSDGEGTNSVLQLSTTAININAASGLQLQGTAITATPAVMNTHAEEFVTSVPITVASAFTVTGFASGYDYDVQIEGFAPTSDAQRLLARFLVDGDADYSAGSADYQWRVTVEALAADGDTADSEIQLMGSSNSAGNGSTNFNTVRCELFNPFMKREQATMMWHGFLYDFGAPNIINPVDGGARFIANKKEIAAVQFNWHGGSTFKAQGDITVYRRRRS